MVYLIYFTDFFDHGDDPHESIEDAQGFLVLLSYMNSNNLIQGNLIFTYNLEQPMITKMVIALVLALEVFVCTILPYYYSTITSNRSIMKIFDNFSAGLFLGIAFLHIIPEANENFDQWMGRTNTIDLEGHQANQLPIGTLITLLSFISVLALEVYFHDGHCGEQSTSNQRIHPIQQVLYNQKIKMRRRLVFETYLTQIALSVHCFFECMSIGIERDQAVALVFGSAIMLHKWAQGFTLGFSYANSGMPKSTALKFATFHSILNGSAVLIGIQLSSLNAMVEGTANAISGGTFLYVSLIQKINKNFKSKQQLFPQVVLLMMGLGTSVMILF